MRSWHYLLFAAASLTFLTAAAPQKPTQPPIPSVGETLDIAIANVDVVVTDKQGNRVRGLTRDDFELFEGKQQKPISNFAEYGPTQPPTSKATVTGVSATAPQAQPAAKPVTPRPPRTLVVFIDNMSLRRDQRPQLFASIKSFIRRTIEPGDAVLVVTWHSYLDARIGFTDDVASVEKAIDRISDEIRVSTGSGASDLRAEELRYEAMEREMAQGKTAATLPAIGRNAPVAATPGPAADTSTINGYVDCLAARTDAKMAWFDIRNKVAALNSLLSSMAGREGKKILLLASHRLSKVAGAEFFYYACHLNNLPADIRAELGTDQLFDPLVKTANANGVTIYPIYPAGMEKTISDATVQGYGAAPSPVTDTLVMNNELTSLGELARATGGSVAWGTSDVATFLPRVADELDSYYSLAYRLDDAKGDSTHNITVRTKNRAYVVRARSAFVEKSDDTKMRDRVIGTLFHSSPWSNMKLTVDVGKPTEVAKNRRQVAVKIPIQSLTALPQNGTNAGAFTVYVAWGGIFGEVSDVTKNTQQFTIDPKDLERARNGYFTYELNVVCDPATNRLAVGVFDEVSKEYGLTRVDLNQPAPAQQQTEVR